MRHDARSEAAQQYRRLYRTARWQRTRAAQLSAHPLCAMCLPRVTPATVCDHTDKDSKKTEEGFFAGPFQSLCKDHHDSTRQRQERREGAGKLAQRACGPDGWPLGAA